MVLNVSDHFMRAKYRQEAGNTLFRVVGLIFGRVEGLVLEIENSLELDYQRVDAKQIHEIKLDMTFAQERKEAYKEMFPNLDVIGYYSSKSDGGKDGDQPTEHDIEILNGDMKELCENPMLLIMNPSSQFA